MKKTYISPMTVSIALKYHSHLMDLSITGTNMSSDVFTKPIESGDPTTSADARRGGSVWDDADY